MNLHTIPATQPTIIFIEDEIEEHSDGIHCPECGAEEWEQNRFGYFNKQHRVNLETNHDEFVEGDHEIDYSDPWECRNGHPAPENIIDKLDSY